MGVCGTGGKIVPGKVDVPVEKPLRPPLSSSSVMTAGPSHKESDVHISESHHAPHIAAVALYYFDSFGRGEVIRLLMKFLSLEFEDRRVTKAEWAKMKTEAEFGQCPVLLIDNKKLVQTRSILRYVAQKHHLYPSAKDPQNIYWLESLCDLIDDMKNPLLSALSTSDGEQVATLYTASADKLLLVEKRLKRNKNGKGWFIGSQISLADIYVIEFLWDFYLRPGRKELFAEKVPESLKKFTLNFVDMYQHVKGYLTTRPPPLIGY